MKPKAGNRTVAELLRDLDDLQRVPYSTRQRLRRRAPGKYADGTVYTVRETRVRAHIRRGYTAVRLTK